jgi:hypothetical protein
MLNIDPVTVPVTVQRIMAVRRRSRLAAPVFAESGLTTMTVTGLTVGAGKGMLPGPSAGEGNMRNGQDPNKERVPLEVDRFIDFMRRRQLDVRLSPDQKRLELFSRRTGKKLCSFSVNELDVQTK